MKFLYRTLLIGLSVVMLIIYFYVISDTEDPDFTLAYISDRFGENCTYNGTVYREGELFSETCKQCYCSFGEVECAVIHCKENRNSLGMDLIKKSIQVLIPTEVNNFAGTITLMNSVLKNTKENVKFILIHSPKAELSIKHLKQWIEGTELRTANYVIVSHHHKWIDRIFPMYLKKIEEIKTPMTTSILAEIQNITDFSLLILNSILPLEHRVVVLNSNVIIKGDILDLYNLDLQSNSIGVISDCEKAGQYTSYFDSDIIDKYKISQSDCPFKASILIADLDRWFQDMTEERLLLMMGYMINNKNDIKVKLDKSSYILPLLLYFRSSYFDVTGFWNISGVNNVNKLSAEALEEAKMIYWTNDFKPWDSLPLSNIWNQYFIPDPTGLFRLQQDIGFEEL